jgi:hypothetical protein
LQGEIPGVHVGLGILEVPNIPGHAVRYHWPAVGSTHLVFERDPNHVLWALKLPPHWSPSANGLYYLLRLRVPCLSVLAVGIRGNGKPIL